MKTQNLIAKLLEAKQPAMTSPENDAEVRAGRPSRFDIAGKLAAALKPTVTGEVSNSDGSPLAGFPSIKKMRAAEEKKKIEAAEAEAKHLAEASESLKAVRRLNADDVEKMGLGLRKGGKVKAKPKAVKRRGDGCVTKGRTKGRMV